MNLLQELKIISEANETAKKEADKFIDDLIKKYNVTDNDIIDHMKYNAKVFYITSPNQGVINKIRSFAGSNKHTDIEAFLKLSKKQNLDDSDINGIKGFLDLSKDREWNLKFLDQLNPDQVEKVISSYTEKELKNIDISKIVSETNLSEKTLEGFRNGVSKNVDIAKKILELNDNDKARVLKIIPETGVSSETNGFDRVNLYDGNEIIYDLKAHIQKSINPKKLNDVSKIEFVKSAKIKNYEKNDLIDTIDINKLKEFEKINALGLNDTFDKKLANDIVKDNLSEIHNIGDKISDDVKNDVINNLIKNDKIKSTELTSLLNDPNYTNNIIYKHGLLNEYGDYIDSTKIKDNDILKSVKEYITINIKDDRFTDEEKLERVYATIFNNKKRLFSGSMYDYEDIIRKNKVDFEKRAEEHLRYFNDNFENMNRYEVLNNTTSLNLIGYNTNKFNDQIKDITKNNFDEIFSTTVRFTSLSDDDIKEILNDKIKNGEELSVQTFKNLTKGKIIDDNFILDNVDLTKLKDKENLGQILNLENPSEKELNKLAESFSSEEIKDIYSNYKNRMNYDSFWDLRSITLENSKNIENGKEIYSKIKEITKTAESKPEELYNNYIDYLNKNPDIKKELSKIKGFDEILNRPKMLEDVQNKVISHAESIKNIGKEVIGQNVDSQSLVDKGSQAISQLSPLDQQIEKAQQMMQYYGKPIGIAAIGALAAGVAFQQARSYYKRLQAQKQNQQNIQTQQTTTKQSQQSTSQDQQFLNDVGKKVSTINSKLDKKIRESSKGSGRFNSLSQAKESTNNNHKKIQKDYQIASSKNQTIQQVVGNLGEYQPYVYINNLYYRLK